MYTRKQFQKIWFHMARGHCPLNRYNHTEAIAFSKLKKSLKKGAGDLLESIRLFDRYEKVGDNKVSLAFTLTFRAWDRTLTSDEVAKYRDSAIEQASKDFGATLRS